MAITSDADLGHRRRCGRWPSSAMLVLAIIDCRGGDHLRTSKDETGGTMTLISIVITGEDQESQKSTSQPQHVGK